MCPRCGKNVKSSSGLTRYINACKTPISLPNCQPPKPIAILENNIINRSNLLSDEKGINSEVSNYGKEGIKPAGNNNEISDPQL